jgi:hypothetical protein
MPDIHGEDLLALRALRAKVKPQNGSAVAVRKAADRKSMMKENDGRRARASGIIRDSQINFKVPSETKALIVELAKRLDRPMVWVLEHGLELILAEEAKAGKGS